VGAGQPAARAAIAVLASGGGSNLQALLDFRAPDGAPPPYRVVLVAGDRVGAGAFARAAAAGVGHAHLPDPGDADALLNVLSEHDVQYVVLAGYLKLVPAAVTSVFAGRILNVHPALLPAFGGAGMYGLRVHRAVLASGARVSGPTVHFVDAHYDRGAILAQWPVPVRPGDTPDALAARVLAAEHRLLPRAVAHLAAGRVRLGPDGRAELDAGTDDLVFAPAG
jgi:formyltetrahydrofolate-dependent phosphoribosylglycinamide formyltransferase